jgi:co-chaperonin GroES (HSP10)
MPAMVMLHEKDPAEVLWEAIGDISNVEVLNNDILVAIYERPEKTSGGVWVSPQTREEDKSQGKVGMVVKMGELACKDDVDCAWTRPHTFAIGDWVVFRASEGWAVTVNKKLCRMVRDADIRMRIEHPDQVW